MKREPIHIELSGGTKIVLRPVRPEDKPLLAKGMTRLSDRSRRLRFLVPTDHLTRTQLAYLTEVDQRDHQAWGVLSEGEPVGVGRLIRLDEEEAEVAITVVDDWQRKGIGEMLVRFLAVLARDAEIRRLIFVSLPENQGIAKLLARFPGESQIEDGLTTTTVQVESIAPPSFVATTPT
ncbi:MAG: GNAT family N-acetyltransferase [Acidimicrobiia bacterium]